MKARDGDTCLYDSQLARDGENLSYDSQLAIIIIENKQ